MSTHVQTPTPTGIPAIITVRVAATRRSAVPVAVVVAASAVEAVPVAEAVAAAAVWVEEDSHTI